MSLSRRILGRLSGGLAVLWAAATLTFLAINLTGGDTAVAILGGPEALPTPQALAHVRAEYHLDRPLREQYGFYLSRLLHGDLGQSYRLRIPVSRAISQQVSATVQLAVSSGTIALLLAVGIATFTAGRSLPLRAACSQSELILSSMPAFVLGILLMLLFSFRLHWLPASGSSGWKSLILPALTLALPMAAILTQILRNELEEVLEQSFILTARARGLSEVGVRLGHALRHALIPLITLSGFFLSRLLAGAVVVETLFSRQGVGRLIVEATSNKDVPLVLGITLLAALTYVIINLLVDLLYTVIDPRMEAV